MVSSKSLGITLAGSSVCAILISNWMMVVSLWVIPVAIGRDGCHDNVDDILYPELGPLPFLFSFTGSTCTPGGVAAASCSIDFLGFNLASCIGEIPVSTYLLLPMI
jgi:hypothetical protein